MYILFDNTKDNCSVFIEKTTLANKIGCSTKTILRKENQNSWQWGNYTIYNPTYIQQKSKRGRNSF